jgi:hypothetical protein
MGFKTRATLLALVALGLGGCASSRMQSGWTDPSWKGGLPEKIIIIGVAQQDPVRRAFEDEFRIQLSKHKIEGIPSYTLFPTGTLDKDAVVAKVKEIGATGVMVTRLLDTKTVKTYVPPTTMMAASFYSTPGYAQTTDYAYLESNLYDGVGGGIIWTGRSETAMVPGDVYGQIPGVVGVLVNELIRIKK